MAEGVAGETVIHKRPCCVTNQPPIALLLLYCCCRCPALTLTLGIFLDVTGLSDLLHNKMRLLWDRRGAGVD